MQENWPLIVPPLLGQIDDETVDFKVKGCKALSSLLSKVDAALLQRTGLGEVFEQALLPLLSYLPTLTPEADSLRLLGRTFPCLLALARTRFPADADRDHKLRSLDKILREGVLRACTYAGDYPNIVTKLMQEIIELVTEMKIEAVKHLKVYLHVHIGYRLQTLNLKQDIIPLLIDNLCNPFITAHMPLLVASVKALQTVILNCWPRVPYYKGEVLRGISVCWVRLVDDDRELDSGEAKTALQGTLKMLRAILVDDQDALDDIERVLRCDSRLLGLSVAN